MYAITLAGKGDAIYLMNILQSYWSHLNGNGTSTWTDAHLTPVGEQQALTANAFWNRSLTEPAIAITAPQSYYVSPLDRCLSTANLTYSNVSLPQSAPFTPTVKELLREALGVHTCDRRSSLTYIRENYPSYNIEDGFSEEDRLWSADHRETDPELRARVARLLDDVFRNDKAHFVSFTAHSGWITRCLEVLGHRTFPLKTGAVIPVLVKAEKVG